MTDRQRDLTGGTLHVHLYTICIMCTKLLLLPHSQMNSETITCTCGIQLSRNPGNGDYIKIRNRVEYIQVASLAQLFPPRSPTVSNPAPDSSLCRAAAP